MAKKLHGDAFRSYLHGYYGVHPIQHHDWNPGLAALQRELSGGAGYPPSRPSPSRWRIHP